MRIACILVAAGSGSRFGGEVPKQFLALAGRPVLRHAEAALAPHVDLLQPVGDAAAIGAALDGLAHLPVVAGGADRQASVLAGLEALAPHAPDVVLVHDGARPWVAAAMVQEVLAALTEAPGAIPALPVADTLKRGAGGTIETTVSRAGLYRAQTPQGFRYGLLLDLHRRATGGAATDDASLLEAAGHPVRLVTGSEDNIKVTYARDLARLERLMTTTLVPRIGTGFDVHVFAAGRKLILCNVEVAHTQGLAGHSDADVAIHALCDAIYGALAEGDIGRHFPPSQASWKDADSAQFLVHAMGRIAARGGMLGNADITLICEQPKITPHAPRMIARLAAIMGVDSSRISVKATTTERLGFTGRGEGIAAQAAVVVLVPA